MKLLFFAFLLIRSQSYVFNQFLHNGTNTDENLLQELNKQSEKHSIRSNMSKKVLVVVIACLTIVAIVT